MLKGSPRRADSESVGSGLAVRADVLRNRIRGNGNFFGRADAF